ncbi:hypothetical protein HN698_01140 [Candidatus Woesearchaeota archaeon]|nr:hypothetical protein [Candidatus Woesearchaeota archaeon]MBT4698372.1 hypothetical protein [Candidatus Woesearchaeota archaeon]MBT7105237.1 hypothetical protein [Candidatus Woesearchaeota archaeon]MBT7930500.1 hypothetical protein [Candidatus Woesearchaeota archaeon]
MLHVKSKALESSLKISPEALIESITALDPFFDVAKNFIFSIVGGFIVVLIIILAVYVLSRGFIWHLYFDRKLSTKYFLKFLLMSVLWFVIVILFITALKFMFRETLFFISLFILVPFYIYFTTYLHILWDEKNAWKTIKLAIKTGFKHLKYHIVPAILALIILIIVSIILIGLEMFLASAFDTIMALILILYLVWLRNYIYHVYLSISKRKH